MSIHDLTSEESVPFTVTFWIAVDVGHDGNIGKRAQASHRLPAYARRLSWAPLPRLLAWRWRRRGWTWPGPFAGMLSAPPPRHRAWPPPPPSGARGDGPAAGHPALLT